jgi:dTDP-4-dehydrorhamnose 3,5-epimerase-like enzyme
LRIPAPSLRDERGLLTAIEFDDLPFLPRRVFAVADVPPGMVRGGHAHRTGQQLLLCLAGAIEVITVAAGAAVHHMLTPNSAGVLVPAMVWSEQRYLVPGSTLLVLCSEPYHPDSYVHEFGTA